MTTKKKAFLLAIVMCVVLFAVLVAGCTPEQPDSGSGDEKPGLNFEQVYAYAQEAGYTGTLEELIEAFKGDSAYQIACQNGYSGTETEWLESLKGAAGKDGQSPTIGPNGNWWIGDTDLGVAAKGENGMPGEDGQSPTIGPNGNWWIGDTDLGVAAKGENGVGIDEIKKTSSDGNVDTYTIYYTDGNTATFTVTNGAVAAVTVTVTFDAAGGSIAEYDGIEAIEGYSDRYTMQVLSGTGIDNLPVPKKAGYEFGGWYTGFDVNDGQWFHHLPIAGGMVLYAKWTETEGARYCTVRYDSTGGTAVPAEKVVYGGKAIEPDAPIKPGYDFAGWYLGEEKWSFVGYSVTEDITLVAKWILSNRQYNLTVISGAGGSADGAGEYLYNETATVSAVADTGYHFEGWYEGDRKVSGDTVYSFGMPAKDYTLTAKFSGTAIISVQQVDLGEVEYGTAFGELALPDRLTATDENGASLTLSVEWNSGDYDAEKVGSQMITGTVTMPESYYYLSPSANVQAVVAVLPVATEPVAVTAIEAPAGIEVKYNTPFHALPLPVYLPATTEDGDNISVRINWRSDEYDRGVLGKQTVSGVLYPEYGYYLSGDVSENVSIELDVIENTIISFDTIDLGRIPMNIAFEELWLPETIGAAAENGEKYHFEVVWNQYDYNAAVEGIYRIGGAVTVPEGYKLADGLDNASYAEVNVSSLMKGIADIAFVVDTTGSMWDEIRNVRDNIVMFAEQLDALGINVRWALIEYRDMTLSEDSEKTQVHMYFSENWYIDVNAYKAEIGGLTANGGGDNPETIIDALETARRLDMREEASRFFIAVTDADYKVDNQFGIGSMSEMIGLLIEDEISVSVVTATSYYGDYRNLADETGGILCNIYGDFADELMGLIDLIDDAVENRTLERIEITKAPVKTEYYSGDRFSSAGMEVTAYYESGLVKKITTYDIEPFGALKIGDTFVTVRYRNKTAQVAITVTAQNYPVTGVTLNKNSLTMTVGEVASLWATVSPANASNNGVLWSSDNHNVVTVSGGRLIAEGKGEANVTVTTLDGAYTAVCTVTVTGAGINTITLSPDYIYGQIGDTFEIGFTLNPADAEYLPTDVIWGTSDSAVCTVTDGIVTLTGVGSANVTLNINGKAAYCMVLVACEHEYQMVSSTDPTCTEMGRKTYACQHCGDTYIVSAAATGHHYVVAEVTEPGCTTDGVTVYECSRCGDSYTVEVLASHKYELAETIAATCTEAGSQVYRCTVCGDQYVVEIPAGGGHDYVGVVTTPPTTEAEGVMTYTCSICSDRYTMPLAKLNEGNGSVLLVQDRLPWTTDNNAVILNYLTANSVIDGWKIVSSTALSSAVMNEYSVIYIANDQTTATYDRLGQLSDELTAYVAAGGVLIYGACDHGWAAGDISYELPGGVSIANYYSNYNYIVGRSHDIITGVLTGGKQLTDKMLYGTYSSHTTFHNLPADSTVILQDANGDPTLAEYPLGAGCVIASGLTWEYTYERTFVDGSSFAKEIFDDLFVYAMSKSSHCEHAYEQTDVVAPTCTAEGYTEYTCTECGRKYRAEVIPATGHDWDAGEVTTEATCTTDGEKTYTCASCSETRTEVIPAAGHHYVDGVCTACGAHEPGYGEEALYTRVDADGNESATGDYILFGSYPQSKVTDSATISALGGFDSSTWTSYGYYDGGAVSDYMYYIDKTYNGARYRGVYFTSYRPSGCNDSSSSYNTWQADNGYNTGTVYWFKYEPIKWRIVEEGGGKATLVAELILDSQQYAYDNGSYNNNYAESTIRAWLNETFYNTAFNDLQQAIIQTTTVDNSAESTGYNPNQFACENTYDKIFLMSYVEATTWFTSNAAREKQGSDYAKSQGLYVSSSYSGNSFHWLRSPNDSNSHIARYVYNSGSINYSNNVDDTRYGVLPALVINLGESDAHVHSMETVTATEATCTEEGNRTYYYCAECGKYFVNGLMLDWRITAPEDQVIPATGHDWDAGEVTTEATCTTDGEKTYTCVSCSETRTEVIPATGHHYVDGVCTACGAREPGYGEEALYTRVDADGNESATGDYILFGSYPQTKVTDTSIISALGDFSTSAWTSYGYYDGGAVSDYMYYIDKTYNGEKYRGVYFTSYRPYYCSYSSSTSDSCQNDNGYVTRTVYWFKYEPIKWRIVEEGNGKATLVAELILDSQQYDYDNGSYNNNYAESTIRAWLNETFYNTAFNDLQQAIIQTTTVDNSAKSTGYSSNPYACENTYDKIFLMSCVEATTWFTSNAAREKQGSDYAKSQGLWVATSSSYAGNSPHWLRSPINDYSNYARNVNYDGNIRNYDVTGMNHGVLPALVIEL